jgi:HK97 family phage major capsid protein
LLAKRWNEISGLADIAADAKPLVYGDWNAGYLIVDRLGMTVELIPHTFGASRRPSGKRGLFGWFRVGAGVRNANALRVLQVQGT